MQKIIALFGIALALVSCTEPIDLNLNKAENVRLVVDAEIDNLPSTDIIRLSYTSNFFDETGNVPADGALVQIISLDTTVQFVEVSGTGEYHSPEGFVGVENTQYTLSIDIDGNHYEATSYMNPMVTIDSLTAERLPEDDFFNANEVEIGISFQDPPGVRNYYWFIDYVNGVNEYEDLFDYSGLLNDESLDGIYIDNFTYDIFDIEKSDTLTVELRTINAKAEEIIIGLASESFRGGLFDSTPSNVPSNISNKALGIFVAYAVSRKTIIIDK